MTSQVTSGTSGNGGSSRRGGPVRCRGSRHSSLARGRASGTKMPRHQRAQKYCIVVACFRQAARGWPELVAISAGLSHAMQSVSQAHASPSKKT
eukprot:356243-Chlamydomonas_euryale.AAC.1